MLRTVQPELLDRLPSDDPEAARSRRDLRLINRLMGSQRWLLRRLEAENQRRSRVVEIGPGDGSFGRRVARRMGTDESLRYIGLDLRAAPSDWPAGFGWRQGDALTFEDFEPGDAVVACLALHHFSDEQLGLLGERLQASEGPRSVMACEPLRSRLALWEFRALSLLGLGPVTRHDGEVSIRAGFRGGELPTLLGLDGSAWRWSCRAGFRGQYFFQAFRHS